MKILPVAAFTFVVMSLAGCSTPAPSNHSQPHPTPETPSDAPANIPELPVDISLENPRARAQLGKSTIVFARGFFGFTSATNIQLCVNAEVVATARESVGSVTWFEWTPKTLGSNSLAIRVPIGETVVCSRAFPVEVTNFKRPQLSWGIPPKSHLWTTNELVFSVQASDEDGVIVTTRAYRDDMNQFFVTNTPYLSVAAEPLLPGTYLYHVQAVDDDQQTSARQFVLDVDATEHPDQELPGGFVIIGHAPDALQLKWIPPLNRSSVYGTIIQRKSAPTDPWRTIAVIGRDFNEWRDQRLKPETYYRYRIAFLSSDKAFRSAFTAEQGEATHIALPYYTPVPIGNRP